MQNYHVLRCQKIMLDELIYIEYLIRFFKETIVV